MTATTTMTMTTKDAAATANDDNEGIPDFPSDGWVLLGAKKSRSREEDSDVVSDTLSLISNKKAN